MENDPLAVTTYLKETLLCQCQSLPFSDDSKVAQLHEVPWKLATSLDAYLQNNLALNDAHLEQFSFLLPVVLDVLQDDQQNKERLDFAKRLATITSQAVNHSPAASQLRLLLHRISEDTLFGELHSALNVPVEFWVERGKQIQTLKQTLRNCVQSYLPPQRFMKMLECRLMRIDGLAAFKVDDACLQQRLDICGSLNTSIQTLHASGLRQEDFLQGVVCVFSAHLDRMILDESNQLASDIFDVLHVSCNLPAEMQQSNEAVGQPLQLASLFSMSGKRLKDIPSGVPIEVPLPAGSRFVTISSSDPMQEFAEVLGLCHRQHVLQSARDHVFKFNQVPDISEKKTALEGVTLRLPMILSSISQKLHSCSPQASSSIHSSMQRFLSEYSQLVAHMTFPTQEVQAAIAEARLLLQSIPDDVRNLSQEMLSAFQDLQNVLRFQHMFLDAPLACEEEAHLQRTLPGEFFGVAVWRLTKLLGELRQHRASFVQSDAGSVFQEVETYIKQIDVRLQGCKAGSLSTICDGVEAIVNKAKVLGLAPARIVTSDQLAKAINSMDLSWKELEPCIAGDVQKLHRLHAVISDLRQQLLLPPLELLISGLLESYQPCLGPLGSMFIDLYIELAQEEWVSQVQPPREIESVVREAVSGLQAVCQSKHDSLKAVFLDVVQKLSTYQRTVGTQSLGKSMEGTLGSKQSVNFSGCDLPELLSQLSLLSGPGSFCYQDADEYRSLLLSAIQTLEHLSALGPAERVLRAWDVLKVHVLNCFNRYLEEVALDDKFAWRSSNALASICRLAENCEAWEFVTTASPAMYKISGSDLDRRNCLVRRCLALGTGKDGEDMALKFLSEHERDLAAKLPRPEVRRILEFEPCNSWWGLMVDEFVQALSRELLSSGFRDQGGGSMAGTTLLDLMRNFIAVSAHEDSANGSLQAVGMLQFLQKNLRSFSSLEDLKSCIHGMCYIKNKEELHQRILTRPDAQRGMTVHVMFARIVRPGSEASMRRALTKLKLVLTRHPYGQVEFFCSTFVFLASQLKQEGRLHHIIELMIQCRRFSDKEFWHDLRQKYPSLLDWERPLLEVRIVQSFHGTPFFSLCPYKMLGQLACMLIKLRETKGDEISTCFEAKLLDAAKGQGLEDQATCRAALREAMRALDAALQYEDLSLEQVNVLSSDIFTWRSHFGGVATKSQESLKPSELLELMRGPGNRKLQPSGVNYGVRALICAAADGAKSKIEIFLEAVHAQTKKNWREEDVTAWAGQFQQQYRGCAVQVFNIGELCAEDLHNCAFAELLGVLCQATFLYLEYYPRDTQLIAVALLLAQRGKGRLGNISTGEGKTLITALLSTCLAMVGKTVDVVTSSKVLAVRDSQMRGQGKDGFGEFWQMLGLKGSNNCDKECEAAGTSEETRQKRYQECQIMYGEVGYFQKDILLSKFFRKSIRAPPYIGDVLILDEVDNMMIDNAVKTLYISHSITDLQYLRDVFLQIWAAVNGGKENVCSDSSIQAVMKFVKQLLGNLEEVRVDLPSLLAKLPKIPRDLMFDAKDQQIRDFLRGQSEVVSADGSLKLKLFNGAKHARDDIFEALKAIVLHDGKAVQAESAQEEHEERELTLEETEKIKRLMTHLDLYGEGIPAMEELNIHVPDTLNDYVRVNLKSWIENAYMAKAMSQNDQYIIGDEDMGKQGEIIIMDKDTGVEQKSCKWSKGLHIFLQLKHGAKMSDETLKAIYISNMDYFQRYDLCFGITGTVGGGKERALLGNQYGVDFFELPRFKAYRYLYLSNSEAVCGSADEWLQAICTNVAEMMDQGIACTSEAKESLTRHRSDIAEKLETQKQQLEDDQELKARETAATAAAGLRDSADLLQSSCFKIVRQAAAPLPTDVPPGQALHDRQQEFKAQADRLAEFMQQLPQQECALPV